MTLVEIVKTIGDISVKMYQLVLKGMVAVLSFIPFPFVKIYSKKTYWEWLPSVEQSCPKKYNILSSDVFNLGHIIVAFVHGKYQKVTIHQVKEITLDNEGFQRDHKVVKKSFVRAMFDEDLKAIVHDYKIIEKKLKP